MYFINYGKFSTIIFPFFKTFEMYRKVQWAYNLHLDSKITDDFLGQLLLNHLKVCCRYNFQSLSPKNNDIHLSNHNIIITSRKIKINFQLILIYLHCAQMSSKIGLTSIWSRCILFLLFDLSNILWTLPILYINICKHWLFEKSKPVFFETVAFWICLIVFLWLDLLLYLLYFLNIQICVSKSLSITRVNFWQEHLLIDDAFY